MREDHGSGVGRPEELAQQEGCSASSGVLQGTLDQGLLADLDRGPGNCEVSGIREGQGQGLPVCEDLHEQAHRGDSAQGEPSARGEGLGLLEGRGQGLSVRDDLLEKADRGDSVPEASAIRGEVEAARGCRPLQPQKQMKPM